MRKVLAIFTMCSFIISCASLHLGEQKQSSENQDTLNISAEGAAAPAASDGTYAVQEMAPEQAPLDQAVVSEPPQQANVEAQAAEHQESQVDAMNEQRSTSELDAAAPETGTDKFYAGSQASVAVPEVEQIEKPKWTDQGPRTYSVTSRDSVLPRELPSKKVSKVTHKKSVMKIAKKSSMKSKKQIAKHGAKKGKMVAKKLTRAQCMKIAKHPTKKLKKEIAMCKIEKKKLAMKNKKMGKMAQSSQSDYR